MLFRYMHAKIVHIWPPAGRADQMGRLVGRTADANTDAHGRRPFGRPNQTKSGQKPRPFASARRSCPYDIGVTFFFSEKLQNRFDASQNHQCIESTYCLLGEHSNLA